MTERAEQNICRKSVATMPRCASVSKRCWQPRIVTIACSIDRPCCWNLPSIARPKQSQPNRLARINYGKIGEGGFGVVYMAEQTKPVRRKVALKDHQAGYGLAGSHRAFRSRATSSGDDGSRQHIAKIFDAGTTRSGQPYFVMELVDGIPITDFCDQQHYTPQQRLELVHRGLPHAIQHAHQKGIIHRDFKPSNVWLVSRTTSQPIPKVIDFGLAKAIDQQLTLRKSTTDSNRRDSGHLPVHESRTSRR